MTEASVSWKIDNSVRAFAQHNVTVPSTDPGNPQKETLLIGRVLNWLRGWDLNPRPSGMSLITMGFQT
jgi:hypothetical protein